jgi:hypothetical protein
MFGLWSTAIILVSVAISLMQPVKAQSTLQTPDCTAANIASTAEIIDKMKDGKQKRTASDEIGAASEALAQKNIDECKAHLLKATLQTK